MIRKQMKQYGFITFGNGFNARAWINSAKAEGYSIMIRGEYAELWK